jgi:hypothetical protein
MTWIRAEMFGSRTIYHVRNMEKDKTGFRHLDHVLLPVADG